MYNIQSTSEHIYIPDGASTVSVGNQRYVWLDNAYILNYRNVLSVLYCRCHQMPQNS